MHGIHIPEADLFLPFRLHECISYFSLRLSTEEELATCDRVVFTSPAEWNPYADAFAEEEAVYETQGGVLRRVRPTTTGEMPSLSATPVAIIEPKSTPRPWPDVGGRVYIPPKIPSNPLRREQSVSFQRMGTCLAGSAPGRDNYVTHIWEQSGTRTRYILAQR
jgi:hypothetical protein